VGGSHPGFGQPASPTGAPIVFTVVVTDSGNEFLVRKHAP
jgi:hypothetical protein